MPLSLEAFVQRWKINALSERGGAQSHFIDLCDVLGEPHPAAADDVGERYTFEKPVSKVYGGRGFADVWLRDHFAWEYKGPHKDLGRAYKQLNDYREYLGNPPLLVVSDFNNFQVHTNFTASNKRVYAFTLDDLGRNQPTATCPLPPLEVLRALFGDYNVLRPERTDARVTQEAAKVFARLAERLEIEKRSHTDTPIYTKEQIAHFLMRLLFCLFADSIELLPNHLFRNLVQSQDRFLPKRFLRKLRALFDAMSNQDRDFDTFGEHTIKYFNGGLFDSSAVIELDTTDLGILYEVSKNYNWAHIAPEIFGTLFERSLNKERRSLIGAHYTSAEDILLLIEPVVMQPLTARWHHVRESILTLLGTSNPEYCHPEHSEGSASHPPATDAGAPSSPTASSSAKVGPATTPKRTTNLSSRPESAHLADAVERPAAPTTTPRRPTTPTLLKSNEAAEKLLAAWIDELTSVRILDPACGSGNFLYLALRRMLDLWLEAQRFAAEHNISLVLPKMVSPSQLFGIETEFYAHELASIVVWIGFLQWKHEHGIHDDREPILQKLNNIQHADAILRYDAEAEPYEPEWPSADYIVGNPPFLGGKLLRRELGDEYVNDVFALYKGRVKAESDLVVYWFEKARAQLEAEKVTRAGLIATQSIRGGANRAVLERIQQTGTIFWAWSDRKWLLQGAAVHVSMVAFEQTSPPAPTSEPSAEGATTSPPRAQPQVKQPTDPRAKGPTYSLDGNPVPFINPDLTTGSNAASAFRLKENEGICFMGTTKVGSFEVLPEVAHKMLSAPLNPNERPNSDVVRPWINAKDFSSGHRKFYVIDFGVDMSLDQAALYEMPFEYLKHHVRAKRTINRRESYAGKWWLHGEPRPELRKALIGKKRYILTPGVSKHRVFDWFNTSTIPDHAIFAFAREDDYFFGVLHSSVHEIWARSQGTQLREVESGFRYTPKSTFDTFPFPWPPGKEPAASEDTRVAAIAEAARELVRLRDAWLNPPGASESDLKDRTLTKLYNKRPEWLSNAHRTLDTAVFVAYNWPPTLTDQEILSRLLALNHQRAAKQLD